MCEQEEDRNKWEMRSQFDPIEDMDQGIDQERKHQQKHGKKIIKAEDIDVSTRREK